MKRVNILVEGQTEETFIREVLAPAFLPQMAIIPIVIKTKRYVAQRDQRGGISSYRQIKRDLMPLLNDSQSVVTTMIDFYGLSGTDFPGWDTMNGNCYQKVGHVEQAFATDIGKQNFIPYLSLHEFEAMLFCNPEKIIQTLLPESPAKMLKELEKIRDAFDSPEEINLDNPPSKRILNLFSDYDKELSGTLIALDIGLDEIRRLCTHFDAWLKQLENL